MANRVFQSIIHQMKNTIDRVCGMLDETGTVIACSELTMMGHTHDNVINTIDHTKDTTVIGNFTYKSFGASPALDYVVFIEGTDESAANYAKILAIVFSNMRSHLEEKFDKLNFVKNIIFDNILPGDIYVKAKELMFTPDTPRVVLLVKTSNDSYVSAFEILQTLFPEKNRDFVINVNETDIALVKEVKPGTSYKDLEKVGRQIIDTFSSEYYSKSYVGIGTVVGSIKDLARSFKEAQIALEIGKVFENDKYIVSYDHLGISRLIYQLPTTLCEMFMNEVFKENSIFALDNETLLTIDKFFENNLNVSETARKLFVHRNTLVYRLEKIKKLTGLDIREFDNAITFKFALMVNRYLVNNTNKF
ncbi:MAG: helix-turn-helix domain-containing protein [Bacillota bacterium]|nr:helix-turn-helix domain-containing protein [Bacillota bacterium]